MFRNLLRLSLCAALLMAPCVQASVLDELGQSLFTGPDPEWLADDARDLPASAQWSPSAVDSYLGDTMPSPASTSSRPGFYLAPVGRSDDAGLGIGIRFPF